MTKIFERINWMASYSPYLLFLYAAFLQFQSYFVRINEPLLGMFRFRETQTAISAYWMTQGGPKVIYETPVMGYPYTIPFEFPFFQWLTALLAHLTPLSVDSSARTISFIFFIFCAALAYKIMRVLKFSRDTAILFIGLLCLSPLYLYWSASSMIESMALAFALAWLLAYIIFLNTGKLSYFCACIAMGILAALEKITTFPSVLFIGAVLTLIHFYNDWNSTRSNVVEFIRRNILKATMLLCTVIVPVIAVGFWVHISDAAKIQNSLGTSITSEAVRGFTLGTLEHRLNLKDWKEVIFGRSLEHILGSAWFVILLVASAFLRSKKAVIAVGICLGAYLIAPLLFWRLHVVHYYYQYANGIFLVCATAVAFRESFKRQAVVGTVALVMVSFFMTQSFSDVFKGSMKPSMSGTAKRTIPPGKWIQENTSPDSALYVFGIDWSSHMHYYAQRKGIAARRGLSYAEVDSMLTHISKYTGGKPLESIVVCDRVYKDWADKGKPKSRKVRLETFLKTRQLVENFDTCALYK